METNFSTGFSAENSMHFNDTAQEIIGHLPFAMKYEFDVRNIGQILELEEEYIAIKKFWCNADVHSDCQIEQNEMMLYIIDRINRIGIFPTVSDLKKIIEAEEEFLETKRIYPQERMAG